MSCHYLQMRSTSIRSEIFSAEPPCRIVAQIPEEVSNKRRYVVDRCSRCEKGNSPVVYPPYTSVDVLPEWARLAKIAACDPSFYRF